MCLIYSLLEDADIEKNVNFLLFIIISIFIHSFVGISILSKRRWGLFVFKLYLYLMLLAIPIGTYISKKFFEYIENNNIEDLYTWLQWGQQWAQPYRARRLSPLPSRVSDKPRAILPEPPNSERIPAQSRIRRFMSPVPQSSTQPVSIGGSVQ